MEQSPGTSHATFISTCPVGWRGNVAAFSHLESLFGIRYVPVELIRACPERFRHAGILMGGGYDPFYDWIVENWPGEKWFRFDSPVTQMELSMAGGVDPDRATVGVELRQLMKLKRFVEQGRLRLFVPSRKAAAALEGVAGYWPNVIDATLIETPAVEKVPGTCGLFCEFYPRKNLATQLFAAKLLGAEVWTGTGLPALYRELAAEFGIPLRLMDLPDQLQYWQTIGSLQLSLQVTITEALNYAVIESLLVGTVPLVSSSVPLAGYDPEFQRLCAVPVLDDPGLIAEKGARLLRDEGAYRAALQSGREAVRRFAEESHLVIRDLLAELGVPGGELRK
jgi:hypothetical protein